MNKKKEFKKIMEIKRIKRLFIRYFKTIPIKGKVLDIGSGSNQYKYHDFIKNELNSYYIGIDISPLKTVNIVCDANYLPFKKQSFNNILCMSVLQYSGYKKVIEEISRVMKKGAIASITIPNAEFARLKKPFRKIRNIILRRKDKTEQWAGKTFTYKQIKIFHKYDKRTFKKLLNKNNLKVLKIKPFERGLFPIHWMITARKV